MSQRKTPRSRARSFVKWSLCLAITLPFLTLLKQTASQNAQASTKQFPPSLPLQRQGQQNTSAQSVQVVSTLEPSKPIEHELAGGQSYTYEITLTEGQYVKVLVEQRGIDIVVKVIGPDGKQAAEFDSEIRNQGQEVIEQVAEMAGSYRLNVQATQKGASTGHYEIRVMELRAATEKDRALQEARRLSSESIKLQRAGKYDGAIPLAENALRIREKLLGSEHLDVAVSLHLLATIDLIKGDYGKAEPLFQRALDIRSKVIEPEHPDLAATLNGLALLHRDKGDYVKAESLFLRALAIWDKVLGPEHSHLAVSRLNLANLYRDMGDYAKAKPLLQRALVIWERALGTEHPNVAATLNSLATLYRIEGNYAKAEPLFQRSLDMRKKLLGPQHPEVAASLNNFGTLYLYLGDYARAESMYQSALAITEKAFGSEHPNVAASLNSLANLYKAKGDYARAESMYQSALAITEKAFGSEHPNVAHSLNNLALVYEAEADYARAEPLLHRAVDIRKKKLGPQHFDVASSLYNLANLYHAKNEYAIAEPLYQHALEIWEKSPNPEHPNVALSLNNLALLYVEKGDIAQAIMLQSRARAISEHNIALNLAIGSESQKLDYLATLGAQTDQTIFLHVRVAPNNLTAQNLATATILQQKGRVLDMMSDSLTTLRQHLDPQGQQLLDQLRDTSSQLSRLLSAGPQKMSNYQYQSLIVMLKDRIGKIEAEIGSRSAEFHALSQPITIEAVRAAIPSDAALIEFAIYRPLNVKVTSNDKIYGEPRYVAYILRRQGEIQFEELPEVRVIEPMVKKWREALRCPEQDVKVLARALEEKVMQPIRARLGGVKQLLISPDGVLNLVPFESLMDKRGQYLINRYSFTYLTSGRDLLRLKLKQKDSGDPLIMAGTEFGEPKAGQAAKADMPKVDSSTRGQACKSVSFGTDLSNLPTFERLSGTVVEAEKIKSLFPTDKFFIGPAATETNLKRASAPRILHIVTHGFFLDDPPAQDGYANNLSLLQGSRDWGRPNANVKMENPLLRSGLALAGANLRESEDEDGILLAQEAAQLNLWGTRLVVLSACDTGVGEVMNGEGVYGLRRALVLAGAETQVMSLWRVDAHMTTNLMIAYYKRLKLGQGRGEALRQVKMEILREQGTQHPYYWASFIQTGEWANLEGKR